jgi:hypothetical protein
MIYYFVPRVKVSRKQFLEKQAQHVIIYQLIILYYQTCNAAAAFDTQYGGKKKKDISSHLIAYVRACI